ncbi:flagellar biosynthetic protein FliO [uncultured Acetatifactor sp.]|jgi:flagellar protein FliO/FliZ|uniref:flagellar biosynthetic protein FliO n=1 Tax=uncultured Acetatifactor sp. TaxID=1671927 RepID=UPI00262CFDD9|nr:flagellar biosynthetic protein FliO [uncultured Acetatifactor sp.]
MALLTGTPGSYAQFITVLLIFVVVLGITAVVTRWLASYQKQQSVNENIEVIETTRIANNKYIQIIRAGEKYMVIAVCKDTVTMLGEIPEDSLKATRPVQNFGFKELLDKAMNKKGTAREEPKDNQLHDEK